MIAMRVVDPLRGLLIALDWRECARMIVLVVGRRLRSHRVVMILRLRR